MFSAQTTEKEYMKLLRPKSNVATMGAIVYYLKY